MRGRGASAPGSATAPGGSAVAGQFAAAPEAVAAEPVASAWGTSAPSGQWGVQGAAQSAPVASQPQSFEAPVSEPKSLQPSFPPSGAPVRGRGRGRGMRGRGALSAAQGGAAQGVAEGSAPQAAVPTQGPGAAVGRGRGAAGRGQPVGRGRGFETTAPTQPPQVGGIATGEAVASAPAAAAAAVPEGAAYAAGAVPAGASYEEPAPIDYGGDIPEGYSRFVKHNEDGHLMRSRYETGHGHRVTTFRNADFQSSPIADKNLCRVYGNSFSLVGTGPTDGSIHQYHCFSSPQIDNVRLRKALVMAVDHVPPHAVFDGCSLFVKEILPQGVKFQVTLKLKKRGQEGEGDTFNLFLRKVSSFPAASPQAQVVYNLMWKK